MLERLYPDGSLGMRVTRMEDARYQIEAPGHGDFMIAADGSAVSCRRLQGPPTRWQRPLYGQVLPLAATLQGLEPLHASAVEFDQHAFAFVAASGTGKTSLATHLTALGARMLADDVVALEARAGGVIAHPGVPTANIAAEQLALLSSEQRRRLGAPLARGEKVQISLADRADGPLALTGLFFLARSGRIRTLKLERLQPPEPRELLGATFMAHVSEPQRLCRQLSVCARIAEEVPVFRLLAPAAVSAPELASTLKDELSRLSEK